PGHTVTVGEGANGSTVTLARGDRLQVVLHSTYWQFAPVSNPAVLAVDGGSQTDPGTNCPSFPASGCAPVTQTYTAARASSAGVSASRTSCGEAMGCPPSKSSFNASGDGH